MIRTGLSTRGRSPNRSRRGAGLGFATILIAAAAFAAAASGAADSPAPTTTLVSRAGGNGPGADASSVTPSISADGRYVAFASRARNLGGASGGRFEIYVRDLAAKTTTLVSRAGGVDGAAAEGSGAAAPTISADGRYVAFSSGAENLSAEDVSYGDVFVRDLATATTTLVSRGSGLGGAAADGDSTAAAISADGRHVAFESRADNLSAEDSDGSIDVFVRDLDTGVTELISRAGGAGGAPGGAADTSFDPSISADGRYVAFSSTAPLAADDADQPSFPQDVFVRDRATATTTLVSRANGATGAASEVESQKPAISADGLHVAFESDAKLTGQRGFERNVFVRDLVAGTTKLVSVGEAQQAGDAKRNPSISADGRYVAFQTRGNGLTAVDAANRVDVFVRDMQRRVTVDASRASGELGVPGDGPSANPSISADGRFVAFDSRATNLSGADRDGLADVFRRQPVYVREHSLPECAGRTATIIGTPAEDSLSGTRRSDVILGLGGDDRIRGSIGADAICAGPGSDLVDAGPNGGHGGSDLVLGGPGADRLEARPGAGHPQGHGRRRRPDRQQGRRLALRRCRRRHPSRRPQPAVQHRLPLRRRGRRCPARRPRAEPAEWRTWAQPPGRGFALGRVGRRAMDRSPSGWPPIAEPELRKRLAMDDGEFAAFIDSLMAQLAPRPFDPASLARAIAYPWARPQSSFLLTGGDVELLSELAAADRNRLVARYSAAAGGRLPILSIGSNAAPEALGRKFAHFSAEDDRTVLALTGRLHDFDVGVAAQPTMYGSMPATLFPSPGTAVGATLLWVTAAQFTQLTWSEISYRLGSLRTRFDADASPAGFDEVLVFVSRFGAFCPEGEPIALAAIPADGRTASELSQEQLLDAAARLAIGPRANAETLVRAIFEDPAGLVPKVVATVHKAALPFDSERWTPFRPSP